MTVTNVPDAYNSVYDDMDIDGDGLTGMAERVLGTNPLIPDNPLKLIPVVTEEEPELVSYIIPVTNTIATNGAMLSLLDGETNAQGYEISYTNGVFLAQWNTTYGSFGTHMLHANLRLPAFDIPPNNPQSTSSVEHINSISGPATIMNVSNIVQFDPSTTSFGDQAWIYGGLTVNSAAYLITICDSASNTVKTIFGHTANGIIDEVWNLAGDDGTIRSDQSFNVKVAILTNSPTASISSFTSNNATPDGGPTLTYVYNYYLWKPSLTQDDTFTLAFGWNSTAWWSYRQDMIQRGVADQVFNPTLANTYNNTSLNCYSCTPFAMETTNDEQTLLNDLLNANNFFWNGHGNANNANPCIGAAATEADFNSGLCQMAPSDVAIKLTNYFGKYGWQKRNHPYRLVVLNACNTADGAWAKAFGIDASVHSKSWYQKMGLQPQAYVGWTGEILVPSGSYLQFTAPLTFYAYEESLGVLFSEWMNDIPLSTCLTDASTPSGYLSFNLDFPLDSSWQIFGDPNLTRDPEYEP